MSKRASKRVRDDVDKFRDIQVRETLNDSLGILLMGKTLKQPANNRSRSTYLVCLYAPPCA